MKLGPSLILLSSLAACSSGDATLVLGRVFETKTQAKVYDDVPFPLETPTFFRTTDVLPDLDVRALALAGTKVYAGTGSGLFLLDGSGARFERVTLPGAEAVVDLSVADDGTVVVAHPYAVDLVAPDGTVTRTETGTTATNHTAALVTSPRALAVGTDQGYWLDGGSFLIGARADVRRLRVSGSKLYAATAEGVAWFDLSDASRRGAWRAPDLADDDVRALELAGGELLAATATGLARIPLAGGATTLVKPGIGGLPNGDLTAVSAREGAIMTGHAIGATVLGAAGKKEHYHSLRWIPDEGVTAVALAADGTRWIGTKAGVARIGFVPTTLTEKAARGEALVPRHWRMDGFVDDVIWTDDGWSDAGPVHHSDKDNDGLWTEMQIGTWCLAYAVTKDEAYYQAARKAMDVMMLEFDVPAVTFEAKGMHRGFITRSLVRDDEGSLFTEKASEANWHRQDFGGRTYYWKDDTSSDEYAGHYFGIPLFYDLCAKDEAEREALRARIRTSTDYLIENGYLLIDLDGQRTTHGHWKDLGVAWDGPDACTARGYDIGHCIDTYYGGGWLNSLEILGHLLATWHMTGDQKYYDAYEDLYTRQHYGKMVPVTEDTWTVTQPSFANHSDHELAMLAYYTLLRYEPNADRRAIVVKSIRDLYEYERPEHNPWQVAVIASAYGEDVDLDGAVESLKDLPTDWRDVTYDNGHRVDAKRNPDDRGGSPQFDRVFPYDEIRTMKWNGNPYAVAEAGNPAVRIVPTPYLIAYWTARYHGLLRVP